MYNLNFFGVNISFNVFNILFLNVFNIMKKNQKSIEKLKIKKRVNELLYKTELCKYENFQRNVNIKK